MSDHMIAVPLRREHIKKGEPGGTDCCAFALALKEIQSIEIVKMTSHDSEIKFKGIDTTFTYKMLEESREVMHDFDDHKPIPTGTLYIDKPDAEFKYLTFIEDEDSKLIMSERADAPEGDFPF